MWTPGQQHRGGIDARPVTDAARARAGRGVRGAHLPAAPADQRGKQPFGNVHGPFASIEEAQAAVDAWRKQYNSDRPHQALAMSYPAARFTPADLGTLGLRIPAELAGRSSSPVPDAGPVPDDREAARPLPDAGRGPDGRAAVELDRVVPRRGTCGSRDSRSGSDRP